MDVPQETQELGKLVLTKSGYTIKTLEKMNYE
jgi:hypothetical protein